MWICFRILSLRTKDTGASSWLFDFVCEQSVTDFIAKALERTSQIPKFKRAVTDKSCWKLQRAIWKKQPKYRLWNTIGWKSWYLNKFASYSFWGVWLNSLKQRKSNSPNGSWIKIDQLDVTCFIISLFTAQHVSNVSTSIFRSLRLNVNLSHGLYCSGSMCFGITVWFGWGGVVSLCRLKH